MDQHIKIAAVLQILYGAFALFIAVLVFAILMGAGILSGDRTAALVTGTLGVVIGTIFFVLAIPSFIAGAGLLKRREWARIVTIILSCIHLLSFPVGTIVGGYSLWVLLQDQARPYFRP